MNTTKFLQTEGNWAGLGYPKKPWYIRNCGCGEVAIANLLIEMNQYANYTPATIQPYCKRYAAPNGDGTYWSGIPAMMKHYGFTEVKECATMKELWKELAKGDRAAVYLMGSKKAGTKKVHWTSGGHYVGSVDYEYSGELHHIYMKDSASNSKLRNKWISYEENLRGDVIKVWVGKFAGTPTPAPTPTPSGQLAVDGVGGTLTITATQKFFGTPQDGYIGGQVKKQRQFYPSISAVSFGGGGSKLVIALQAWCGVQQDGILGKGTCAAWQYKLRAMGYFEPTEKIDGVFGVKSMKAWQTFLNNGGKDLTKKDDDPTPTDPTPTDSTPNKTDYKVIDISYVQKDVDFDKVKADGIGGVIVRCGYRGYETGQLNEDSQYQKHLKGAHAAGLPVGVYFFTEAINAKEGREEADYTVALVKKMGIPLSYPIAIDTEAINAKNVRANGLSKAKRTAVIKAFCERIKELGYEPMIYASTSWLNNKLDMSQLPYKVWCAQYYTTCEYKGDIVMWQYSSTGKVNGIKGNVDMNHCYINPETPTPKPTPEPPKPEEKKSYAGSYPTDEEIRIASHNGIINRICSYGKKAAESGKYVYIKYLSKVKRTHQCPKCHNHKGKKGGNCIWFPFFCWRHGGGINNRCACDAMTDQLWEKVLNAKTDAKANQIVRKRLKIDNVEVIRNGGKEIPQSMLKAGDICAYFKGNDYVHTVLRVFNNLIADCTSGRTPNLKYGVKPYKKWDIKIALRYTGSNAYLQFEDEGNAVTKLQNYVDWYFDGAFFKECGNADGKYGKNTLAWVKKMQTDFFRAEEADGTVGAKTIAKMKEVKK